MAVSLCVECLPGKSCTPISGLPLHSEHSSENGVYKGGTTEGTIENCPIRQAILKSRPDIEQSSPPPHQS